MNPLKIIQLLIVILFVLIPPSTLAMGKHALLIGIQDYNSSHIKSLKGTINDVQLMQGVLRERFDFQDKDFTILLDSQATHSGIEKAFIALIEKIKNDDFVYIHYSGHGSQTQDLNGDERRSSKDQTWVSYGARTHTNSKDINNYDVLDDEINAWLAAIYAKTARVIFVSDSCHSATVARGAAPTSRAVKKDNRSHPLGKKAYTQIEKYQGIRVGAARDNESAIETTPREDGKIYGLFTWYWAKALQQVQKGETWHDVFKKTYTPITAWRGQAQKPQMEGERNRQVLGGDFKPLASRVSVIDAYHKYIEIQAGYTAGITVGSVYRLYNPQHPNSQNLPRFTITEVKAFMSYGESNEINLFKRGNLVIEESHAYPFVPIKVYLSADYSKDKSLLQTIQAAFQPSTNGRQILPGYILTNDPYNTDLRLHLLRPKHQNGQLIRTSIDDALPKSFPNQSPELWVLTPEQRLLNKNLQIQFNNSRNGMKLLRDNLNKLARVRELKMLQSHHGKTLPIAVQSTVLSPVKFCSRRAKCMRLPYGLGLHRKTGQYNWQEIDGQVLNKGDIITFTLSNKSEKDYYCYLINIGVDGAISAIFPNPDERMEYARVKMGKKRELTISDGILMTNQVGEETIKLITTTQPIDISLLEQPKFKVKGGDIKDLNPLERLLVNAVHGVRGTGKVRNDEWATGQVIFKVK
ncbi:caspase family protein [Candidatus Parabeggiatoa sp. HSG14]|uniref:caspase family protein n=1 Tax=Candidatus Parabeggiatoa sp. HSG14 TaxID=3055593 RepID=UPI0025A873C4|nr:caspase family protein [Thiotrichales bacterium HSG14]